MPHSLKIKCAVCGKAGKFIDAKDLTQSKWRILGWNIRDNEPTAICEKCEYLPAGQPVAPKKPEVT